MAGKPNNKHRQTMIAKLGSEEAVIAWYREIGKKGGSCSNAGGFAQQGIGSDGLTGSQRAKLAGAIGGRISRRKPKKEM